MRILLLLFFSAFYVILSTPSVCFSQQNVHRIGVFNAREFNHATNSWSSLATYLNEKIPDETFEIVLMRSSQFDHDLRNGKLAFAVLNPLQYIDQSEHRTLSGLATMQRVGDFLLYGSAVFVRSDNDSIKALSDLKGKRLGAVQEQSLGGWVAIQRELMGQKIDPFRDLKSLRFLGSSEKVVAAVLSGDFDAGVVRTGELEDMVHDGILKLSDIKVIPAVVPVEPPPSFLYSSRLYPEWVFAKAVDASDDLAKKVLIALLQMSKDHQIADDAEYQGWVPLKNYNDVKDCMRDVGFELHHYYGRYKFTDLFWAYRSWIILALVVFFIIISAVVYLWSVNSHLREMQKKLAQEKTGRGMAEEELRRNEIALKNMIYDLSHAHEQIQTTQLQLLQTEKLAAIGQLVGGVSHEINNPLGSILSNISVLNEHVVKMRTILERYSQLDVAIRNNDLAMAKAISADIEQLSKQYDLDFILQDVVDINHESLEGAERIRIIVNDLKAFSRQDAVKKEYVLINELIDGVLNIVHNELKYKATVVKDYGTNLPQILCQRQQIGQVFVNLFINAAQAIDKKGEIRIQTRFEADKLIIKLSDTGAGIPKEYLARIFDPFFTTKAVGKGTGLGLSVSYDIILRHGGSLTARSEQGQGSQFTILLPVS